MRQGFPRSLVLVDRQATSIEDQRRVRGTWSLEEPLQLFCCSGNAGGFGTTTSFYSRLIKSKCDGTLGETLGLDDNQLNNLFQITFGLRITSKSLWFGNVTKEPYLFAISTQDMVNLVYRPVQDANREEKPSCKLLFSIQGCCKCGLMLNLLSHEANYKT